MPHQGEGVAWLLDAPRRMLAWEMGVGKTATALRAWELCQDEGPLLVLCLATARENWRREAHRFALDPDLPPTVQVIKETTTPIDPRASVVVVNYDKLLNKSVRIALMGSRRWGTIVLDEAHVLKSAGADRTKIVYGGGHHKQTPLIRTAGRVWALTGTPMPNHPGELWTHARYLWPEAIQYRGRPMEEWEFQAQFCNVIQGDHGPRIVGGRNLAELKAALSPHMDRRKRDLLTLPPLRIDAWPLDMDRVGGAGHDPTKWDGEADLLKALAHYGPIEQCDNAALDALLACIHASMAERPTVQRETGVLKAIATGLLLNDEFEQGGPKTVVFAWHREALDVLSKTLAKWGVARVDGRTPHAKRDEEIDRFQTDPACRVFVGQIKAAGASINLQAAANVVFAEASWTPGDNEQCLSRVYRQGQTVPVLVRFTYLKGSVDEAINRALARKVATILRVID